MNTKSQLSFLIAFAVIPGGSSLAGTPPEDLTELALEELIKLDVVVAASRYEQGTNEAPSSVTIISREDIRDHGYQTIAEVLSGVPGFYNSCDRNYQFAGVRGFSRPGDYNSRILLLLDGHRLNENIYLSALLGNELAINLDIVERVEVVRGPSSSVYGTNAFLGVINIVTRGGSDVDGLSASAGGASYSTYRGQFEYGRETNDGVEILLSGTTFDTDGQSLYYPEYDDPETNGGIAENGDFGKNLGFLGRLSHGPISLQGFYSSNEKGVPTGAWETVFNDPRTKAQDVRGYLAFSHDHRFDGGLSLRSHFSYDWYDYNGDYAYEDGDNIVVTGDGARGRWWNGTIDAEKVVFGNHRILTGGEFRNNTRVYQTYFENDDVYLDDNRPTMFWAWHMQDEFRIRANLIINAGIRHDQYETFKGTTNPRTAIIWRPIQSTSLKLLYGAAFRAPNAFEMYYSDVGAGEEYATQMANPELKPERIRTYEIVLEQFLTRRIGSSVSLYSYKVDDLISLATDEETELLVFRNVDAVEARGAEVRFNATFPRSIRAAASAAYQDAEDRATGETLTNSPRYLAKLKLSAPVVPAVARAGLEVQYVGDRKTPAGGTADQHTVVSLTCRSLFLSEDLELIGRVSNLFDADFGDPASGEHLQETIAQDGRRFDLRLRYRF